MLYITPGSILTINIQLFLCFIKNESTMVLVSQLRNTIFKYMIDKLKLRVGDL